MHSGSLSSSIEHLLMVRIDAPPAVHDGSGDACSPHAAAAFPRALPRYSTSD
jgi:hypothetical protein